MFLKQSRDNCVNIAHEAGAVSTPPCGAVDGERGMVGSKCVSVQGCKCLCVSVCVRQRCK